MFNVVCLKYGTKYSSDHVNVLYEKVSKNLSVDHRFICFTDCKKDIDCETFPIPCNEEGWWGKLSLFKKSLYDVKGQILFIDLDMHIKDSINEYFEIGDKNTLFMMRDLKWKKEYSSAIMRFPVGKYDEIWNYYNTIKKNLKGLNVGDQNIINIIYNTSIESKRSKLIKHLSLNKKSLNKKIEFWPDEWQQDIRSYRKGIKSNSKIIVGYGSSGIFDLNWFK